MKILNKPKEPSRAIAMDGIEQKRCEDFESRIVDRVLEELPDDISCAVDEHVERCPSCRQLLIIVKHSLAALASDPTDPADDGE